MEEEDDLLRLIKIKFPRQEKRIDWLYEQNPNFRVLCKDYLTCTLALKRFKKSLTEEERSIEEYEGVLAELEKELYTFIF